MQENVAVLLDNNGYVVVKCKYDAWGKCNTVVLDESATEIANLNPFRYRSYYFDTETGFYFLKTRYFMSGIQVFNIGKAIFTQPDFENSKWILY